MLSNKAVLIKVETLDVWHLYCQRRHYMMLIFPFLFIAGDNISLGSSSETPGPWRNDK
jgi:hypothetical protein